MSKHKGPQDHTFEHDDRHRDTIDVSLDDEVFIGDVLDPLEETATLLEEAPPMTRRAQLPEVGVFKDLSREILDRLLLLGQRVLYESGEPVNEVGDPCLGLSFILRGQIRVDLMDALGWMPVTSLEPGDLFGAMEWIEEREWEERLIAERETEALFIPTFALKPLSAGYPELRRQVERYTQRHTLQALLGEHELFQHLSDEDLKHLTDVASVRQTLQDVKLFDPSTHISVLFFIDKGEVRLNCGGETVAQLGRGGLLNVEIALGDGVHELTAVTVSPTTLFLIPYEEVEVVLARAGQLLKLHRHAHQRRASALGEM